MYLLKDNFFLKRRKKNVTPKICIHIGFVTTGLEDLP